MTRLRHSAAHITTAAVLLSAGCVAQREVEVFSDGRNTDAVLAAARANELRLFADRNESLNSADFTSPGASLTQHTFTDEGADFDVDIDPTGRRLVFASTRHNARPDLYLQAVDGIAVTQLTSGPVSDVQPTFSPDGRRIAFASDRSGSWDIWVMNVEGGPPVQITRDSGNEVHPGWSSDGRQLVYCAQSPDGGSWELWIADASAGAAKRFIGYGLFPEWSPTGNVILFQRARERGSRWYSVWTLTLVDGEPRYPTELASSAVEAMILPTWSPDGTRVAFSATTKATEMVATTSLPKGSQSLDLWLMNADGRGRVRVTDGHSANFGAVFAADGRLFFTSNRSGKENIWSVTPVRHGFPTASESTTLRAIEREAPASIKVETASMKDDL